MSNAQGKAKKRWLWWLALGLLPALVLASLLSPIQLPIYSAIRTAATNNDIIGLEAGLEAFKAEFGIYPPSDSTHDNGAMPYGRSALVYYLMGPNQTGWGALYQNTGPFDNTTPPSFTKFIVPYYVPDDPSEVNSVAVAGGAPLPVFCDAFSPGKPILYFRAEPGRDPLFDVHDNPTDPTGATGFVDQAHFEMLVRPDGKRWVREDYLLISPGADRLYGPMAWDPATGKIRPARPGDKDYLCDDLGNFHH